MLYKSDSKGISIYIKSETIILNCNISQYYFLLLNKSSKSILVNI